MVLWRRYQSTVLIYAVLLLVLSGMVVPLVWTLLTSFKYNVDVTLGWIPPRWTTDNYTGVFRAFSFLRYYANSLFIATAVTVVQVATSALAAYAFARLQFRGRDVLFLGYLSTMMIPADVLMIPDNSCLMKKDIRIAERRQFLHSILALGPSGSNGFSSAVSLYLGSHYIGNAQWGWDSFFSPHCASWFVFSSAYGTFHCCGVFAGLSREIGGARTLSTDARRGARCIWHVGGAAGL